MTVAIVGQAPLLELMKAMSLKPVDYAAFKEECDLQGVENSEEFTEATEATHAIIHCVCSCPWRVALGVHCLAWFVTCFANLLAKVWCSTWDMQSYL